MEKATSTAKSTFEFNPLSGTMFPRGKIWQGEWSESGGAATHDIAFGEKNEQLCVAFRKKGSKGWAYAPVTKAVADAEELASRAHKGYVLFKGSKLHIWLNYAKGHEGDEDHVRYDLKPSIHAPRPL